MIPESSFSLAGRDVVTKCFCDILNEVISFQCLKAAFQHLHWLITLTFLHMQTQNSQKRSETQSNDNQPGAVGNGSDPEWLSELLLRVRTGVTTVNMTQSHEMKQKSHELELLSAVTGNCLEQDYLEHVLQQAGGNVQVSHVLLCTVVHCTAHVRKCQPQVDCEDV